MRACICWPARTRRADPHFFDAYSAGRNPNILAVGLYDGTVAMFDVKNKNPAPTVVSTAATGKHSDPVWKVRMAAAHSSSHNVPLFSTAAKFMRRQALKYRAKGCRQCLEVSFCRCYARLQQLAQRSTTWVDSACAFQRRRGGCTALQSGRTCLQFNESIEHHIHEST